MRRLGRALDCSPMAIYHYAADKDALLDGLVEQFFAEVVAIRERDIDIPDHWESVLRSSAHAFRRVALAHPNVVPLVVTRPLSIPLFRWPVAALQTLEDQLDLLIRAGFDEPAALQAARLFNGFLYGHILHELHEQSRDPEPPEAVLRFGPRELPTTQLNRLRSFISVLSTRGGAADLDVGVTVLITGLREQLLAAPSATR